MSVIAVDHTAAIHQIGETIMSRVNIPKDRWEIAAQLEVLGYRDIDARERFGCRDLFEAADRILGLFHAGTLDLVAEDDDPARRAIPGVRFIRHYLDGLMFSLPMVLQGATMLLWGYGLWGARDLDPRSGSAIALGFIASYIVTSGFTWAIVSRGLYYHYQKEGALARWSALRMWSIAVRVTIGLAIPALLFGLIYRLLPLDMTFIALAYYTLLVVFWLNWALIYLVRRTAWLLAVLTVSILAGVVMTRVFGWPVVAANLIGLAIADALSFLVGFHGLTQWAKNAKRAVNPPRLTVLVYATAQVFLYGLLYSAFIFTDRILAWTATRGRPDFPPYPFWLNASYELGMDLALIVVVLLSGVVEYSAQRFSVQLVPGEKRVKSETIQPFLDEFQGFYRKHSVMIVSFGIVAVGVAALVVNMLKGFPDERLQEGLAAPGTIRVFWIAAISYAIFMFAMQKILMLMILSRADVAVRVMATALLVDVVAGFALSRAVDYSASVFGLLAGSIVLAVLAHRRLRGVLGELDYFYYAAY